MSHLASHLVADWLAGDYGVNAIAATMPRRADHDAPGAVTVYCDLDDEFVAQGQLPTPEHDPDISYPAVLVYHATARYTDGLGWVTPEGRMAESTVTVAVQLVVRQPSSVDCLRELLYLTRATRNALMSFSDLEPTAVAARTDADLGVRLDPATSTEPTRPLIPVGDHMASATLVVTFPVLETTVLR